MTKTELAQPKRVFFEAGKTAYRMGIHIQDCPYKLEPFRTQWVKGWKVSRKNEWTRKNDVKQ